MFMNNKVNGNNSKQFETSLTRTVPFVPAYLEERSPSLWSWLKCSQLASNKAHALTPQRELVSPSRTESG